MKNKPYTIAVLTDLKDPNRHLLKNGIGLAKKLGGEIALLHVKKPADVVRSENALSARRSMHATYVQTDNALMQLSRELSGKHGIPVRHTVAVGNIKQEINDFLDAVKPDVIVLGKRKPQAFGLLGDRVTDFVLNRFDTPVMIASETVSLHPDQSPAIGQLNGDGSVLQSHLAAKLMEQTEHPLVTFRFVSGTELPAPEVTPAPAPKIEYVFDSNANARNNLARYISKCKLDVLFTERKPAKHWNRIAKALKNSRTSVLMANG